jgi:D-amino-acid oxidase
VSIDPHIYLHYLQANCLTLGARFRRATISHIGEALSLYTATPESRTQTDIADIVVNACGLFARELGGVNDDTVTQIRGQLVIVANEGSRNAFVPTMEQLGMNKSIGEVSYVIQRPAGMINFFAVPIGEVLWEII